MRARARPEERSCGASVNRAAAPADGRVTNLRPAAQGGQYLTAGGAELYIAPGRELKVKVGDPVEAGDILTDGELNIAEYIKHKGREYVMAADAIGEEIGKALHDSALGLAVWAAVHGLAMLVLEDVIDLGQRRSGLAVLPSRAEILLRSLFSVRRE